MLICNAAETSRYLIQLQLLVADFFCYSHSVTLEALLSSACCCKRLLLYVRSKRRFYRTFLLRIVVAFPPSLWVIYFTCAPTSEQLLSVCKALFSWGLERLAGYLSYLTLNFRPSQSFRVYFPCIYSYIHEFFTLTCKCTNESLMWRLCPHLRVLVFASNRFKFGECLLFLTSVVCLLVSYLKRKR
jgi:hypothetical protein